MKKRSWKSNKNTKKTTTRRRKQAQDNSSPDPKHLLNFLANLNQKVTGQTHNNMTAIEYTEELRNYYESIIGHMPNNVYWLDTNCVLLGGNDNLAKMFGLNSRHDLVGLTYEEMTKLAHWTEGQGESFKKAERQVMITGIPQVNIDEPPFLVNGEKRYFMSSKVPLYNSKQEVIGVVGISTDITERKKAEAALKEAKEKAEAANKAKTEFLENMRHDIRTPLIGITGFANIIKEEASDPKIKEYVENLTASSYALLDLLNEIIEVIKVNSGEVPLLKKKFDLKKRLQDVVTLHQAKAHQKHIKLLFSYDSKLPPYVIGDPTRIHRIALELVANALNFTDHGSVSMTVKRAKAGKKKLVVKIIVEDTGIGIAPEKQQEIFLKFTRLTPSYEGIYKGAGLGLAIVKQFLNELGGEIYVESALDKGTKFTCVIPLKQPLLDEKFGCDDSTIALPYQHRNDVTALKVTPTENTHTSSHHSPVSRILLVEDHAIAAKVVTHMLSDLECKVDVAPDGNTAMQLMQENNYDLIFMDIGLPKMNGYEVTKRIRLCELSKGTHIPIIALTAHLDEENKQRCIEAGMNAVLAKPLVKEKAEDILNAFVPYRKQPLNTAKHGLAEIQPDLFKIEGNIIDFELAKRMLNGKEELVHDMLNLLVNSLPEEQIKLQEHYTKEEWPAIQGIAHKLKGGASYCGTIRLKEACSQLEEAIKKGSKEIRALLYQQLLSEFAILTETVRNKSYLR